MYKGKFCKYSKISGFSSNFIFNFLYNFEL
jgi:hypothetical protein